MRFWVGVSAAFGAGTLIGIGVGTLLVEDKLKKEYKEATASHWRAVQAAKIDAETPALTEEDLIHIRPKVAEEDGTIMLEGGPIETVKEEKPAEKVENITSLPQTNNSYHQAVQQTSSITGGIYVSYAEISEEEYQDEDGRFKEQITMLFSDGEPIFFKDGAELEVSDAMDMVGSTIVDDMRAAVREGNPFVWVRNNQTEVDYEVVFEQP